MAGPAVANSLSGHADSGRSLRDADARGHTRIANKRDRRHSDRFDVALATSSDDAAIRQLLRENPLRGEITLSLEREPDSRFAATIEGDLHQTILARERSTGRIAAIGSRSVHDAFVNGERCRLGYLGQLRIAAPFRASRELLDAGFAFCRDLHGQGDARFYLASVVADNLSAHRLLLAGHSTAAPAFRAAGRFNTLVLPRRQSRRMPYAGVEIRRGSNDLLEEVAACLARHGRRHQFSRAWTAETLESSERTRGLSIEDFIVAMRRGRVVGCVACWDQRSFKQAVVRGYSPRLSRWRWLVNGTAAITGLPKLPDIGRSLQFVYLSHLAIDEDPPEVAPALVCTACHHLPADIEYVVTGIAASSPVQMALTRRFRHRTYQSCLYTAFWQDGACALDALDRRLPHPELALL